MFGAGLEGSFFSASLVILPTLLALSRHLSARRRNTRIPYSWNVPLVLGYKSILHCHGVSDKVLYSRNPK